MKHHTQSVNHQTLCSFSRIKRINLIGLFMLLTVLSVSAIGQVSLANSFQNPSPDRLKINKPLLSPTDLILSNSDLNDDMALKIKFKAILQFSSPQAHFKLLSSTIGNYNYCFSTKTFLCLKEFVDAIIANAANQTHVFTASSISRVEAFYQYNLLYNNSLQWGVSLKTDSPTFQLIVLVLKNSQNISA